MRRYKTYRAKIAAKRAYWRGVRAGKRMARRSRRRY